MKRNKFLLPVLTGLILIHSCKKNDDPVVDNTSNNNNTSTYTGTGAVSQGSGTSTITNLFPSGTRISAVGTVVDSDGNSWTVPSATNYTDNSFPFAPDLHNIYGTTYNTAADALAAFNPNDVVVIDAAGEVITGYIFGDNYFELYVNGVPIGKDAVPFTDFNSHIVQFKVSAPYTIAMKLVDWEEHLGIGCENNGGFTHHPGDGGMVAVFKDSNGNIVATTGSEWKAQTFYTAPIKDLSCPTENGTMRLSSSCNTDDSNDGSSYYGLHWAVPTDWMTETFDDSAWPSATTYTNTEIGVGNKPSYTNFTDIFDDVTNDAEFIWSTNVILDNEVIVRYTVQ